jgi:hypothetical protein
MNTPYASPKPATVSPGIKRGGDRVTMVSKRCKRCRSRLNDPAYPNESADQNATGVCRGCRVDQIVVDRLRPLP